MAEVSTVTKTSHYGNYPTGTYPILLAYGFRPFFLLLPLYLILSIVLWGLLWGGVLPLQLTQNPMDWHQYEMLFGLAGAGIAGFLLTAIPEFFEQHAPLVGKPLLALVLLWLAGRISFWLIDFTGIYLTALLNVGFYVVMIALVAKPILTDPLRRQWGLLAALSLLVGLQVWFFAARLGWLETATLSILQFSIHAFMILVLLVLRRVGTAALSEQLEHKGIDAVFLARPPRYNFAIFIIALYGVVEYIAPQHPSLAWLALAAAAAVLNLLNDYFEKEVPVLCLYPAWLLWLTIILMALGYGLLGMDHLNKAGDALNHFRHVLTSGALGLAYLAIMSIVAVVHTGRDLQPNYGVLLAAIILITATALRSFIPFYPTWIQAAYLGSALLWASAFAIYLWQFAAFLWHRRVDGLSG